MTYFLEVRMKKGDEWRVDAGEKDDSLPRGYNKEGG